MAHHRKTPRAQRYDYTSSWGYFITICTKDREHYFGEIENGEMVLNELGEYATQHWDQIYDHYPLVETHAFICMPNHIHGIMVINESVGTQFLASWTRTDKNPSLQSGIYPKSWSLGAIIRWYKIGVTKYANEHDIAFARQWRYHDHIIRDEWDYDRIKYYIQTNPENRWKDKFN